MVVKDLGAVVEGGNIHGRQVAPACITRLKCDRRLVHKLGLCPATRQDTWLCLKYVLVLWQQHIYQGYFQWPVVMRSPALEVSTIGFWGFLTSKNSKPLGSDSLTLGWLFFHIPPASDLSYCLESSFLIAALPCVGSGSGRSCTQTPVASLSCSGAIHLDTQGAEERVVGLLPPLGCIPCYASSHELQDPRSGQQTDFESHPAPWEGWLGKLSVTKGTSGQTKGKKRWLSKSKGRRQSLWFSVC